MDPGGGGVTGGEGCTGEGCRGGVASWSGRGQLAAALPLCCHHATVIRRRLGTKGALEYVGVLCHIYININGRALCYIHSRVLHVLCHKTCISTAEPDLRCRILFLMIVSPGMCFECCEYHMCYSFYSCSIWVVHEVVGTLHARD